MAERGLRAARPYDSTAGVSTACASIAICGQGLSRSPSSCSSAAGPGAAIRAAALTLSGSGSRAATPCHAGPSPCGSVAGPAAPAAAAVPLHSSSRAATPRRASLDSPYLRSPPAKSATPAAAAMLLLHSSSSGSRAPALSPLHTGSRPLLPGGHFLPAMPHPHSPSAVQLSGQGSPSAAAAWHRPKSAVLPFKCPREDRMGQGGGTGAGTGTGEATQPHQTQHHQLPASSACAARLNPLLAPLPQSSQRSRSSIGSGTASPCPITRVGGNLDCERSSVGSSAAGSGTVLPCSSARVGGGSGSGAGGNLDFERSSVGSSSLLSGDSSRARGSGTSVGGSLDCGGGGVSGSSLLSGGSILLRGGSSRSLSLASHSPATSHNGDASLHLSTSPPVDALPHPAPRLRPCDQLEAPRVDVVSGNVHAPAAAVGEIGAAGAAAAAAAAVGAEAAGAGAAEAKASSSSSAAAPAAVGPGQSSGRWTQLEAALTMAPPPSPWQHTQARPPTQSHAPSACMHSPPGSPSPGLAHSRDEPFHAHQLGLQQEQPQPQQPRQQPQQQGQQGQQRVLCDQRCEGQQGQARHGSSRGSSRGASRDGNNAVCCSGASESTEAAGLPLASGATAGGADAPCSAGAGESIEATGVLQANMAMAGPAACSAHADSTDGDAGGRTQPVIATAAEGRLQQQPQVSEDHGGKGRTQLGSVAVTEEQSPGVGEEGQAEPATLTKRQPQRRPEDGELGALEPQADEAGEESDAEAEGRVLAAEKGGEEVDGAVGRKKKKKQKAKASKRALKTNGSNASNGSAGSNPCSGLSNSSSRCGGSRGSNSSGRVGDVGCGSRGSNVSSGVGNGSRGSSRGASAPAVADAQVGRNGCASTCSSGSGSARAGDSGKRATVPLQGPPNGPLSSNTGGPISIVGQGPSGSLANPIGRASPSPSPGVVKGRSMSTGRGCGVLQRTAGLDGTSDTLLHRGGGALHTASSSVHCSPARTSRRSPASSMHLQGSSPSHLGGRGGVSSPASSTMPLPPLPPLAATQLPTSRGLQEHSAFHTSVANVTSRFSSGEALVARSGGGSGSRGSVTGVMSQAEGEVAGREALDLREERRKAHERLEAYSKAKQAKAQEAAMEDANRRRAIQDARNAHKAAKERQREEVYALNAILRMSEQAFINQLLEAAARSVRRMTKDEHSELEAAAEHAAAVAAASASAGGAAVGHAAAAVVGAARAGGAVADCAANAAATAAAADSARGPGALSPEGSFSSSVHDSPSSVRQAAGASDAAVLSVGGVNGVESAGGSGGRSRPASALAALAAAAASRPQSALGRALRAHPALPGSASGAAGSTTSIAAGAGGSTGCSTGRVTAGTADTVVTKGAIDAVGKGAIDAVGKGAIEAVGKGASSAGPALGLVPRRNVAGAGGALDGDDVDDGFIAEDGEGSDEEQADVSLVQSILSRMAHGV